MPLLARIDWPLEHDDGGRDDQFRGQTASVTRAPSPHEPHEPHEPHSNTQQKLSQRRETTNQVIEGFKEWTSDSVTRWAAPNFRRQVHPLSLGQAEETKADWLAWFKSVEPLFRNFTPTVHDIYEDADANKVVARCTSSACTPVGPYRNEYMIVLYFTEDQRKIERFLEFVDAGASMEFFPRLHKWVAEHPDMKW